jgi:type 1 fimbria pilin
VTRGIIALTLAATLALAGIAWAATSGKYAGTSRVTISGTTASHPFGLTVRRGKVVNVSLIAGSNCAALNGQAGIDVKFKINVHGRFKGTLKFNRFKLQFTGHFHGRKVTGSFAGTAKGLSGTCPVPKNTFTAKLPAP